MTSTLVGLPRSLAFWGTALVGIVHCGSSEPAPGLPADASNDSIHTVGDSAAPFPDVVADVALSDATHADVARPADSSVDSPGVDSATTPPDSDSAAMFPDVVADVAASDATQADVNGPADSSVDSSGGDVTSSACSQGSDCASGEVCVLFPYGSSCRADPCAGQTPSCACGLFACAPDYTCQSASTGLIQCHRNG